MPIDAENVTGQGGGSALLTRNLNSPAYGDFPTFNTPAKPSRSTADYLGVGGLSFSSCYDLNTMGTFGSNIQSANGQLQYMWIIGPNHHSSYLFGGLDATCIYRGFSNDPTILPNPTTMIPIVSSLGVVQSNPAVSFTGQIQFDGVSSYDVLNVTTAGTTAICFGMNIAGSSTPLTGTPYITGFLTGRGGLGTYTISVDQTHTVGSQSMTANVPGSGLYTLCYFPQFVYNPDTGLGHLYLQCVPSSGASQNNGGAFLNGVWTTSDAITFTFQGIAFTNWGHPGGGTTETCAQQQPMWLSANNWISFGVDGSDDPGQPGYWTSTTGLLWTFQGSVTQTVGASVYGSRILGGPKFTVSSQDYALVGEDARGSGWSAATTYAIGNRANVSTADTALFMASVHPDGMTLDVSSMISGGSIAVGLGVPQVPFNNALGTDRCRIASFGTGSGGVGTYTLSVNQLGSVSSQMMSVRPVNQNWYAFQTYQSLTNSNTGNYPPSSPSNWVATTDGFQYVAKVAIDSHGNVLSSPAPVRISNEYDALYPGPTYMGVNSGINESGFNFAYADHGFYASPLGILTNTYTNGGALSEEYYDIYYTITDLTAAKNAAPFGVKASCSGGNVLIRWYDISPNHTYRVKRATSYGGTYGSLTGGDVSVGQFLDTTATPGSVYYYKVITLNSGTEEGSRIVSTYVGVYDSLTNAHITRALAGGADQTTISEWRIAKLVRWLNEHNRLKNLKICTFAWLGVAQSSTIISRFFDLATTYMPRLGDLTPTTTTTTYSSTAINSTTPGWVNANSNSFSVFGLNGRSTTGLFGRLNPIRNWSACTFIASYQKSNTNAQTFIGYGEGPSGGAYPFLALQVGAGASGTAMAQFAMSDGSNTQVTAQATTTSATVHIIAGTNDGNGNLLCYVEGVAGSPPGNTLVDNSVLYGQIPDTAGTAINVLTSGSANNKFSPGGSSNTGVTGSYVFENNQAQYTGHSLMAFDVVLSAEEMRTLTQLLRDDINYGLIVDNIKTTYSAVGDGQILTTTWTTSGTTLTCNGASPFVSGDAPNKYFALTGAGTAGGILSGKITGFTSANQVTMSVSAITPLSTSSQTLEWASDDAAAFAAFNTARAGSAGPVELDVPAGRYALMTGNGQYLSSIRSLRIIGSGTCTTTDLMGTGIGINLSGAGTGGQAGNNTSQASVNSVSAGSSTITLKHSADASLFSPPCYALMTGLDVQGYGYPTNQQFYDWVYIRSIVGTTVTIESPLKNSYKDTWPLFNAGNSGQVYCGGPATLYAITSNWDSDQEVVNFSVSQNAPGSVINSIGRLFTYTGGTYAGGSNIGNIYPSRNKVWTCNGVTTTTNTNEFDKLNAFVFINGGHFISWNFQNPSPDTMTCENVVVDNLLTGTPKNATLLGCYFNGGMRLGTNASGFSTSVYAEACSVANIGASGTGVGGAFEDDILGAAAYAFVGRGVIKRLKSAGTANPPAWGVPGCICFIGTGPLTTEYVFQVTDVYEDGTYVYIQTAGPDGFPVLPTFNNIWRIQTHPCPQLTFVACVGCVDAVDMSGAPTAGAPMYSYSKRTYSNWNAQQQASAELWGRTVSYKLSGFPGDVAYMGMLGSLTLNPTYSSGTNNVSPTGTLQNYNPTLDMLHASQRIILPGSVTGGVGLDSLGSAPGTMWWTSGTAPFLASSISGESSTVWPVITIELVTDQSVVQTVFPVLLGNTLGLASCEW